MLDTLITDQDIVTIARDCLVRWEDLSSHLELPHQQEHNIELNFRGYENRKLEALRMWKRVKGNGATYRTFITTAESISNMQLAEDVRALLRARVSTGVYMYVNPCH